MNSMKKWAMIIVAVIYVIGMAGLILAGVKNVETASSSVIDITVPKKEESVIVETKAEDTSVLLVDGSGSMNGIISANAGYDYCIPFSTYLGQVGGESYICTNIDRVLRMGVKNIGVITDCESWPVEEMNSHEGSMYKGIKLTFFVPEAIDKALMDGYIQLYSECIENESSSLIFCYSDGSKEIIFDNFGKQKYEDLEKESVEDEILNIKIQSEKETSVTLDVFLVTVGVMFTIIIALIEALIALIGNSNSEVPEEIEKALKVPMALDGSGSVANEYAKMIEYAKKIGVRNTYRFANEVKRMSLQEAENISAGGTTNGWTCLQTMYYDGCKDVTIVSDFDFSDTEMSGISFKKVTLIVAGTGNSDVMNKITSLAESSKIIHI